MVNRIVWLLFSFNGRLGRLGFFTAWLGLALCSAMLQMATIGNLADQMAHRGEPADPVILLLRVALGFALGWCHFAIQAKRFHDFNWSGWWVLAPGAIVVGLFVLWIGGAASNAGGGSPNFLGLSVLTIGAFLFLVVIGLMLLFRGGTAGPNTFGPQAGPPVEETRTSDWAQRILDDPVAAAERLRERDGRTTRAATEQPAARPAPAPMAAASGERVFGRRNARA